MSDRTDRGRHTAHGGLFDGVLAAGPVRAQVDDRAWLQAMLDAEAALSAAQADIGLIPREHADQIAAACRAELYDIAGLGEASAAVGNPAAPLVRALTERVGGDAGGVVHWGATSQDIVDTAAMLIAGRALGPLLDEVEVCADYAAALAAGHRDTIQAGRTLMQQALPTTFGLTAVGWLAGLDDAADRLVAVRRSRLAAQLGGAAGTLASLGEHGPAVLAAFSRRLGLAEPATPWHPVRTRIAELAGALGEASGAIATVARDISLLAQTEIGEVREVGPAGSGGSSTLPHKQNPVAAIAAMGSAMQAPGLVANLLAAMPHELQRAAGAWHAEWRPFGDLLRSTGSAATWLRASLGRLHVDAERMRVNLDLTGGLLLAERVTTRLTFTVGRMAAQEAVTRTIAEVADGRGNLLDLLAENPVVAWHLSRQELASLLDPAEYLGSAGTFVDRGLADHANRRRERGSES